MENTSEQVSLKAFSVAASQRTFRSFIHRVLAVIGDPAVPLCDLEKN